MFRTVNDGTQDMKHLTTLPGQQIEPGDRPDTIVIVVSPHTAPGRYRAHVEGEKENPCESRQPFLDGARKLLARGNNPRTMLVMRWAGAKEWALRGPLGVAAELTVDEHNGTFAKWKPYSSSAVPPGNASSTRKVPRGPDR
jgi:hypothetical protein